MNISLIQMVSSRQLEPNLTRAGDLISEAAKSSDFVFLPENFAALAGDDPLISGLGEAGGTGPICTFLADTAQRLNIWIFGGTLPISTRPDGSEVSDGRVRAASMVYNPAGELVARYDKIHMFDVLVDDNHGSYRESATFEPGEAVISVDTPLGNTGLTVCYDLRFPELYRQLFNREVDLIAAPSAFTEVTGAAHFELLMRARAVENSCFMVAACQGGAHDSGRRTHGHSMVVDPWGDVVGELGVGEGVLTVDVDLQLRQTLRRDMPFHKQRRLLS